MKVYLYLARRDKSSIKIITVLNSSKALSGRLTDPSDLQITASLEPPIRAVIESHKMLWEPWVETANSYQELTAKLLQQGFYNLPNGPVPLISTAGKSTKVISHKLKQSESMIRKYSKPKSSLRNNG